MGEVVQLFKHAKPSKPSLGQGSGNTLLIAPAMAHMYLAYAKAHDEVALAYRISLALHKGLGGAEPVVLAEADYEVFRDLSLGALIDATNQVFNSYAAQAGAEVL